MENAILNDKELKLIVESLLYSASVDVCSNWYKEDVSEMLNIAKKIRNNKTIFPEDVFLVKNSEVSMYYDEITDSIVQNFPEIKTIKQ